MEHVTEYLKKLTFDPKLAQSYIARYLTNPRLILLLIILICAAGIYSYISLPRNLNPEIKIPLVIVNTVLPGASPQDIESLVTVPLEDAIEGIEKIKTVTSTSQNSVSTITVEFETGIDPEKARTDVQSAIDGVRGLPTDAQDPKAIKIDFENQPFWQFSITGGDQASLSRFSKVLKDRLDDQTSVDRVTITGLEEQEIQIIIKPESIITYNLNPAILSQSIKTSTQSFPAGTIKTSNSNYALTIDPAVVNIDDIRKLLLNINGNILSLEDVATIVQANKPDQNLSFYTDAQTSPQRAINFSVFRSKSVNINQASLDTKKVIDQTLQEYNHQFVFHNILNTGDEIDKQFNELQRDFILTISLVFIILFIFVGLRQAVVALFSTPLTFFITFTVMSVTGISLSFISLFSLLLSLGLLVDDTIVVISAMSSYYRAGKFTPLETGLLVWRDFFIPILTTTITTVWAFIPLLLAGGIIGEFIKPIPIVVSTTLLSSLVVALLITLPLVIILLKPQIPKRVGVLVRILLLIIILAVFYALVPKNSLILGQILALLILVFVIYNTRDQLRQIIVNQIGKRRKTSDQGFGQYLEHGVISFGRIDNFYRRLLTKILSTSANRRTAIAMVVIFSLFSYLLFPLGLVKNEFFPKTDENQLFVGLELPKGTNIQTSQAQALKILEQLRSTPESNFITATLGQTFSQDFGSGGGDTNNVLFTIVLPDRHERDLTSTEIANGIRLQFQNYQDGKISVTEVSGGPPAGADLQIKLLGDDLNTLDQKANQLTNYLSTQSGVTNPDKSIKSGTSKLVFEPDLAKMARNNITLDNIGLWLRTYASGFSTTKLRLDESNTSIESASLSKERDLTLRIGASSNLVENINLINIPTPNGSIPLSDLGSFKIESNPTLITREDGKRSISVTAGVTAGGSISTLNQNLEKYANSELNLPPGYSWKTGGVNEENQRSVTSILMAMVLSFLLIITTMVVQFSSFRKAMIVMLVIPLSISGVFIIFALTNIPLSFPALIGVLALFGIVVKNAILVVDKINKNLDAGMEFKESVVDGSVSRLEAISLTSMATIAGLIPITLSDPLWQGLGGAIIAGLTFSGTIMLFFIPVVYFLIFRPQEYR